MDCSLAKALAGLIVGAVLSFLSIIAIQLSSDFIHYITAVVYLTSGFLIHPLVSTISKMRCSIKQGFFLYLSVTLISWIAIFNIVYTLTRT